MQLQIKTLLLKYRRPLVAFIHAIFIFLAYFLAFFIRFEFNLGSPYFAIFKKTLFLLLLVKFSVFYFFGLFSGLWRYVCMSDLWQIIKANVFATGIFIIASAFIYRLEGYPRSIFAIDFFICLLLVSGVRFLVRSYRENRRPAFLQHQNNILVIGAGQAGLLALKEFKNNPSMGVVIGFIDDDPTKKNSTIHGVKMLGGRDSIARAVAENDVKEIVLAMPSAEGKVIRQFISLCQFPNVKIKTIPSLNKIIEEKTIVRPRDIKPEDLLGRDSIQIDETDIGICLKDKVVLITGAGGSIGSELCRQIVHFLPARIILFDHNENDVYFLTVELKTKFPAVNFNTVIGDIKDIGILKQTFYRYRPGIVFHAAAHKHVPLMEENPTAAVKNNILGTRNLIYASHHYLVERFVFISTDKAVNPVNVMGMSKRICEMILQAKSQKSRTKFMAVRFGNVMGSAGSVVPLLKKQIEEGGPMTITHLDVERYFMSVKEAALLVLQAGCIGQGGEIFVLDMGEQIKVIEIAKNLAALSGYTLNKDIEIKIIGMRPGEKLSEELFLDKEKNTTTQHKKIYKAESLKFDLNNLNKKIKHLERLAYEMNDQAIAETMKKIITSE